MLNRFADFMAGITECHRYVLRIKNLEMTELGLKGHHMMCLFCLGRSEEGLTAAQLAAMCFEDKAAISRSIADLENGGYVAPADPNVKYRSTLVLTEKGEKLVEFGERLLANVPIYCLTCNISTEAVETVIKEIFPEEEI